MHLVTGPILWQWKTLCFDLVRAELPGALQLRLKSSFGMESSRLTPSYYLELINHVIESLKFSDFTSVRLDNYHDLLPRSVEIRSN